MKELKGKIAIVTGAAQGIGFAIAKKLSQCGASIAIVDIDSDLTLNAVQSLENSDCIVKGFVGDVADKSFVDSVIVNLVRDFGSIDILVNNAGIIRDNYLSKISQEDWDQVLNINLKGPFLFSQAVFEAMKKNEYGKIVNIISRAWLGNIGQSNYSASKGGLVSLTRTLALELARFQINVNGVAPGLIDTAMTQSMPKEARERLIQMQPTKKMGTVEDIAEAVAFLSSDQAKFITGQILHVDGGKSCGLLGL